MTPERIAELRALADAATSGPWLVQLWSDYGEPGRRVISGGHGACRVEQMSIMRDEDAEFVAAARTAIPELLDEVERLRERQESHDIANEAIGWKSRALVAEPERDKAWAVLDRVQELANQLDSLVSRYTIAHPENTMRVLSLLYQDQAAIADEIRRALDGGGE